MYFKLEVLLNKLAVGFQEQEPLTFAMGDQQGTTVTIRPLTIEEKEHETILSMWAASLRRKSTCGSCCCPFAIYSTCSISIADSNGRFSTCGMKFEKKW